MEFKKGDVCSLEVVVQYVDHGSTLVKIESANAACTVPTSSLTFLRRAPVDLETCDLSEPVRVLTRGGVNAKLVARHDGIGWLCVGDEQYTWDRVGSLIPLDAPAPESEVDRLRAALTLVAGSGKFQCFDDAAWDVVNDVLASTAPTGSMRESIERQMLAQLLDTIGAKHLTEAETFVTCMRGKVERLRADLEAINTLCAREDMTDRFKVVTIALRASKALASTAPTCPPGHIMIGDRAVPEPMRVAPETDEKYWMPYSVEDGLVLSCSWDDHKWDRLRLQRGLIHSTEANARAHAEAIIALSAGEGV